MSQLLSALARGTLRQISDVYGNELLPSTPHGEVESSHDLSNFTFSGNDPIHVRLERGKAALRHFPSQAQELFKSIIRDDPSNYTALLGLASSAFGLVNFSMARDCLNSSLKLRPNNSATLFACGLCAEMAGERNSATNYYRASNQHTRFVHNSSERVAAIALSKGNKATALGEYMTLYQHRRLSLPAILSLVNLLYINKEFEHADIILEDVLVRRHTDEYTLKLGAQEPTRPSKHHFQDLHNKCSVDLPDPSDLLQLARLHRKSGDNIEALPLLEKAVGLRPDSFILNYELMGLLHQEGLLEQAALTAAKSVALYEDLIESQITLALAKSSMHQKPLGENPLIGHAQKNLNGCARTFIKLANLVLERSLSRTKTEPEYTLPNLNHTPPSHELSEFEQTHRSIAGFREIIANRRSPTNYLYGLGLLLIGTGDLRGAVPMLQRTLEINPCHKMAGIALGLALMRLDHQTTAREILESSLQLPAADYLESLYELGLIFPHQTRFNLTRGAVYDDPEIIHNVAAVLSEMGSIVREDHLKRIVESVFVN